MNLDSLKISWEKEIKLMNKNSNFSRAMETLEIDSVKFDKTIQRRDFIEISVALLMIPFLVYQLTIAESVIGIIGLVVLILTGLYIPYKLVKTKKIASNKISSIKSFLHTEKAKVLSQIKLLESIIWWYLGPIFLGIVLVTLGKNTNDIGLPVIEKGAVIYLGICLILYVGIYFMNKFAARKKLFPLLETIETKIIELEEDLET